MRLGVSLWWIQQVSKALQMWISTLWWFQMQHAVVWSKPLTVAKEAVMLNINVKRLWDQLVTLWPQVNLPMFNRPSFFIPQGSRASQPLKPPCRPGFSQNFYTVIVSRDVLHGQRILKGKSPAAGSHLLTDVFSSLPRFVPQHFSVIDWVSVKCVSLHVCVCVNTLCCGCATWAQTCIYLIQIDPVVMQLGLKHSAMLTRCDSSWIGHSAHEL